MPKLTSNIDSTSAGFADNHSAMMAQVSALRTKLAEIQAGGGAAASARHCSRGKLLPRERIDALLDPGSPFLEL